MKQRVFLSSALLAGIAILLTAILITLAAYRDFYDSSKQALREQCLSLQAQLNTTGIDQLTQAAPLLDRRVTLISPGGSVLYDNVSSSGKMDNHLARPEVASALLEGTGESLRFSDTLREQTYYYAVLLDDGTVLRLSHTTASVFTAFDNLFWLILLIVLVGILASSFIASRLTRRIVKPINAIDLDHPETGDSYEELTPLLRRIADQHKQIRQQMRTLDQQRREFSAITDHMSEGFLVLDKEGRILSHNKSALKLLDYEKAQAAGKNVLHLNRSNALHDIIQNALAGSQQERILPLAGRQCQVMASPVWEASVLQGLVVILMDVTEKQEREQLRREFTANVSHELKTPLTAISGYAEIIMNGVAKQEDIPAFSESIYQEAQRLIALVKDLMFLSKLDEFRTPEKEQADLYLISQRVAKRLETKADDYGVTLSVTGTACPIYGIPFILDEIIDNLIDNGIKYNRPGGSVSIRAYEEAGQPVLQISDTGTGIPDTERERIFERFLRVDKSRNEGVEGTGLGLAIVKHGVKLHDASITVESSTNGSCFTIVFPKP